MKYLKYPNGVLIPVADEEAQEHAKRIMRDRQVAIIVVDDDGKAVTDKSEANRAAGAKK